MLIIHIPERSEVPATEVDLVWWVQSATTLWILREHGSSLYELLGRTTINTLTTVGILQNSEGPSFSLLYLTSRSTIKLTQTPNLLPRGVYRPREQRKARALATRNSQTFNT